MESSFCLWTSGVIPPLTTKNLLGDLAQALHCSVALDGAFDQYISLGRLDPDDAKKEQKRFGVHAIFGSCRNFLLVFRINFTSSNSLLFQLRQRYLCRS